jgi:hypothetical protein
MHDWAEALRLDLNTQEKGLASAVGLRPGMSSEEFEETLGALLRWRDLWPLNERFAGLGGERAGKPVPATIQAHERQGSRLKKIMTALNFTLFRLFGTEAIDQSIATTAWGTLLEFLGEPDDLTVVTTNYDPAAENALAELGRKPDTGFDRPPGTAPILNPHGMVARSRANQDAVAVLHLHGAVGWYEMGSTVQEQHQNLEFNPTLGRPVVLYPDPDKDPTRDAVVQALWEEFDAALEGATHVLVLGHSLRDSALVAKLSEAAEHSEVAVCVCVRNGDPSAGEPEFVVDHDDVKRMEALMPARARFVPGRFGPGSTAFLSPIAQWIRAKAQSKAA